MSRFGYVEKVGGLPDEQRLHFYEVLAHQLTVVARMVWSDPALDDAGKVEHLKWLNEVLHLVTAKIPTLRLKTHEWTEEDSLIAFAEIAGRAHLLAPRVGWAIRLSYSIVTGEPMDGGDGI